MVDTTKAVGLTIFAFNPLKQSCSFAINVTRQGVSTYRYYESFNSQEQVAAKMGALSVGSNLSLTITQYYDSAYIVFEAKLDLAGSSNGFNSTRSYRPNSLMHTRCSGPYQFGVAVTAGVRATNFRPISTAHVSNAFNRKRQNFMGIDTDFEGRELDFRIRTVSYINGSNTGTFRFVDKEEEPLVKGVRSLRFNITSTNLNALGVLIRTGMILDRMYDH